MPGLGVALILGLVTYLVTASIVLALVVGVIVYLVAAPGLGWYSRRGPPPP